MLGLAKALIAPIPNPAHRACGKNATLACELRRMDLRISDAGRGTFHARYPIQGTRDFLSASPAQAASAKALAKKLPVIVQATSGPGSRAFNADWGREEGSWLVVSASRRRSQRCPNFAVPTLRTLPEQPRRARLAAYEIPELLARNPLGQPSAACAGNTAYGPAPSTQNIHSA